jgi:predicted transcriptional regulator
MEKYRKKVERALKENPDGFTVSELARELKTSRQTIATGFAFLEGAEKVKIRQAGMAKIYFWIEKEAKSNKGGGK